MADLIKMRANAIATQFQSFLISDDAIAVKLSKNSIEVESLQQ